ncbi:MAG: hypothetical protein H0W31_00270 [Actinobacteria bacterium]|nr:hypothetical protein [Actinomycetota bacterium]
MARYSSGMVAAGAGVALRPIFGILSTATVSVQVREIKLVNTTAVVCQYEVVRFTGGTAGTGQAEVKHRPDAPTAIGTVFGLWTADATIVDRTGEIMQLGAAIGSGDIATFGDTGLETALGATAGIGLVPIGTGQVCVVKVTWDE